MIKEAINTLVSGGSLSFEQSAAVMEEIMGGEATPAQIAAFVTSLRIKGETVDEIAGLASVMRAKAVPVKAAPPLVDTCGTGGDNFSSINISTAAAFVAAGAGLRVAAECLEKVGIGFMFAPLFHPAMKHAAGPRREIGIRTVFNILGPLTNPARAGFQVIGVPDEELGQKIAAVLHRLGTEHSLVVHSLDGMDELSLTGKSVIWEVNEQGILPPSEVEPSRLGLSQAGISEIRGGTPEDNAGILNRVLSGEKGPARDVVVLNTAAAIYAGNLAPDLKEGVHIAENAIDRGQAKEKLEGLIRLSNTLG